MKRSMLSLVGAALLFGGAAEAHVHLIRSTPANGSRIARAPEQLTLGFSAPMRLTSLRLEPQGGKEQRIGSLPKEAASTVSVPVAPLPAGAYTVVWRAVGADGHVMSGEFRFDVAR